MNDMPPRPTILDNGSYHPVELINFLDLCRRLSISNSRIARHLGVEAHRIIYAMGLGNDMFRLRALKYEGLIR